MTTKVLTTGSLGKIGQKVVPALLKAGFEVTTFNMAACPKGAEYENIAGDIRDINSIRNAMQRIDAIVHLAAIPYNVPGQDEQIMQTNVIGTWNILKAASEAGIERVINFSSINALGHSEKDRPALYLPLDDEIFHYPLQSYQLSKHIGEEMCTAFANAFKMTIISLRPSFVSSPEEYNQYMRVPEIANMWEPFMLGDMFSYIDVRDVAQAVVDSLVAPVEGHQACLLTAEDSVTNTPTSELIARYYSHLPWPNITKEDFLKGPANQSLVDCSKAKNLLNWQPRFTWRDPSLDSVEI